MNHLHLYDKESINHYLESALQSKQVNYMRLLYLKEKDSKLSITLQPIKEFENYYHGLHPLFDDFQLKSFLNQSYVINPDDFWKSIDHLQSVSNDTLFNILSFKNQPIQQFQNDASLKTILLARCILQMSLNYGYLLHYHNQEHVHELEKVVNQFCDDNKCSSHLFLQSSLSKQNQSRVIKLIGIWPLTLVNDVVNYFDMSIEKDGLYLVVKQSQYDIQQNNLYNALAFNDIENYTYVGEGYYYSGVMPRVMKVEYKDNQASNTLIKQIRFHVCKTTYATVDMMDNTSIVQHPFFNEYLHNRNTRSLMMEFDHYEDKCQTMLYHSKSHQEEELIHLNHYLQQSFNTHTIAVSCNIKTADGYYIAAKRNTNSIDAGEYYCTANGQSEFIDKHVSFYQESVFEDMPTMVYDSEYRVDLNNELRREVIAELGISSLNSEWNYVGVSFLSVNNTDLPQATITKRRMHFNVLALNKTPLNYIEVKKNQSYATERLENEEIIGFKPILINSIFDLGKHLLLNAYRLLDQYKSKVLFLIFIISYLIARNWNLSEILMLSFEVKVDIILIIGYLGLEMTAVFRYFKMLKNRYFKFIILPFYISKSRLKIASIVNICANRPFSRKLRMHGIFILMLLLSLREESFK